MIVAQKLWEKVSLAAEVAYSGEWTFRLGRLVVCFDFYSRGFNIHPPAKEGCLLSP